MCRIRRHEGRDRKTRGREGKETASSLYRASYILHANTLSAFLKLPTSSAPRRTRPRLLCLILPCLSHPLAAPSRVLAGIPSTSPAPPPLPPPPAFTSTTTSSSHANRQSDCHPHRRQQRSTSCRVRRRLAPRSRKSAVATAAGTSSKSPPWYLCARESAR